MKSLQKIFILATLLFISLPLTAYAYSDYIIAGGENIGIEIQTKGIIVAGTYDINKISPAKDAGLKPGDIIVKINNTNVNSVNDMTSVISNITSDMVKIEYLRNDKTLDTNLKLYNDNGLYKTGIYVKDSVTGIGTLTFIDPNTKIFGALGHEITEKNTGNILNIRNGSIFASTVTSIEPSTNGSPGEKNARYDVKEVYGTINENTKQGIFGNFTYDIEEKNIKKVAKVNDIKKGKAYIRTVLDKTEVKEYEINITSLNTSDKTKNIAFEITDEELLKKTGGIVQGMSGSPIIQGDYIIGGVTHVVIENPKNGYGIFITNMLEEAEN